MSIDPKEALDTLDYLLTDMHNDLTDDKEAHIQYIRDCTELFGLMAKYARYLELIPIFMVGDKEESEYLNAWFQTLDPETVKRLEAAIHAHKTA